LGELQTWPSNILLPAIGASSFCWDLLEEERGLRLRSWSKFSSDELVGQIVGSLIREKTGETILLDGYPRNTVQAEFLDSITDGESVYAVNISVEEGQVIRRLSGRRFCSECGKIYNTYFSPPVRPGICDDCGTELLRRPDDREEVIAERMRVYREQTRPVIDFFRSKTHYFEVDGNWEPQAVFEELCQVVRTFAS